MTDQPGHSLPLFEGSTSRRHQVRTYRDLRADALAYAGSGTAPDLADVRTLVQFAGFPRSGHSLIGSLIDAHPDAVVAHELDLMGLVDNGLDRNAIFSLICANSAEFERHGRHWNGYRYHVETGTGGTSSRPVVLGDKKADWAVRRASRDPSLLDRLGDVLSDVRGAWIVVVRNPFDNVATMSLRSGRAYDRIRIAAASPEEFRRKLRRAQGGRVPATVLTEMVDDYAALCAGVASMRTRVADQDWLVLRHEDMIADPETTLVRMFAFLGLPLAPELRRGAAATVSTEPHRSRCEVNWPVAARERVQQLVAEHPFLHGYDFDEP